MNIAIDMDDVLSEFSEAFLKYIHKRTGARIAIRDLEAKDWWQAWSRDKDEAIRLIHEFLGSDEASRIRPKPGAVRGLKLLKQAGHKLWIITGRPADAMEQTRQWLQNNLPEVFEEVLCTDFHIANVGNHETKGTLAERIKASVLIDDYPGYARECLDKGIKVLLFDGFWNQGYELPPGVVRVHNWDEILIEIGKINNI